MGTYAAAHPKKVGQRLGKVGPPDTPWLVEPACTEVRIAGNFGPPLQLELASRPPERVSPHEPGGARSKAVATCAPGCPGAQHMTPA